MGLTIHWTFKGPKTKTEAKAIIEKMRQRAMDLPFASVGEIAQFKGENAQFDRDDPERALPVAENPGPRDRLEQGRQVGWDCPAKEIIGFQILVAPGSEPMEVFLATYPRTITVKDERGRQKRLRTNRHDWSGEAFCKTQYASNSKCGGVANFLRAHLSVVRMLDHAKELGMVVDVSDEGEFWEKRDVRALAEEVGSWNAMIGAFVGAMDDAVGQKDGFPHQEFPGL